jgi:putative phage-type endonuclease
MSLSLCSLRRNTITATDMATLFGLNKYESPAKLLEKKRNPVEITNNHVRRGKLKEPSVLEAFLLDANMRTTRHESGTLSLPGSRIAATPDAYVEGTNNVVEAKSVMSHSLEKWYDEIPTHYHMQVFTQMLVVGSDHGYIGALEEGDPKECEYRFVAWRVERVAEIEEMMIKEVERFWDHVTADKLFRVDSNTKRRMLELLPATSKLLVPTVRPPKEIKSNDEELSRILSLFD